MIQLVGSLPAVVRILLVFALIILAIKRNWSLGHAFLTGSIALGLMFSMSLSGIAAAAGEALIDPKTLSLCAVVCLILVLSHSLEICGQMERLLMHFKGLVRQPRISLVIFPALIGLLPMPGGAIFSAPMVKTLGEAQNLSSPQLSYINYWFRHIWEYWWPLYPGILLTTALAGIDLWNLVACTLPLSVVALSAGYWPLRGIIGASLDTGGKPEVKPFLKELAPILLVIGLGLLLGQLLSLILPPGPASVAKELGLITALTATIFWTWRLNGMPARQCWTIVRQPSMVRMFYMIAAILVFKGILEQSGAVGLVSDEMLRWHIPMMSIAMALPFLVGLVAGITIAFVGAAFPVLVSLIHSLDQGHLMVPYMMLALASGFCGVLMSPLHLCLILSNGYFRTSLAPVYRLMKVPLIAMLAGGASYFVVLRYFLG